MTGRTLIEMSPSERADMLMLVVNALESVAEDAGERGDLKSARNATYLACSIRGCGIEASTDMLRAAEILLEQGISYVVSLSERFEGVSDESDEPEVSSEHQSRILH
ncbi:hypothetical protein [Rhizobium sp. BK176]|uniref:hypothetical protein n=1 Tax=Rhizobium sp. BK176 TaxID=2587071 RepID=UPI002167E52D|nr:hypothetical protein [Rhizobium sp. BK176]MCS4095623.1 hypothetical protein [Rhizobium sp. BK176]